MVMTRFRASLMILIVETDLKEPPVPEPWEHAKDTQGVEVKK